MSELSYDEDNLFELFIWSLIARVSKPMTSNCLVFIFIVKLHRVFNLWE